MTITVGTKAGSYEIASLIGEGGMGRVFRAHDTKLKRDVAIKILPDEFSCDADRVARFQCEAEVLASLNHPHIAAIHDVAEFGDSRFLVLELVEGETLAERIARGPIPIDESLAIAKQIAEALEAAHEKGIIHRDLKPANIKFTIDGNVKVLDFGLAKVHEAAGADASRSNSPTLMSASMPGMIMGTAAYMSPEQARGKSVDRAADIWAFACVLYEMLTGRKTFDGETITDILGAIVRAEPDWSALPGAVPAHVRRLLRRCLEKDRRHRLRDAAAVLLELQESSDDGALTSVRASARERWAWILVSALAVALLVSAALALRPTPAAREMRLEINTPPTTDLVSMALSPDAQRIVFVGTSDGQPRLWVRSLDSVSAHALAGTDGASYPFWSAASRSIGFFADGKLKRIDIAGGTVQTLASAKFGRGGTWNREGVILFSNTTGPILRVSAGGGQPSAVTRVQAPQQTSHRFPKFLPDGRHFLFYSQGSLESRGVYAGSLDAPDTQHLFDADTAADYVPSGYLLFSRQGILLAQKFDPVLLKLSGDPFPVSDQVAVERALNIVAVSASAAGPVAYRPGTGGAQQLVWFDRSGKEIGTAGTPDMALPQSPVLSPDGRRVALQRTVNGNADIWLVEIARGVLSRFTVDAAIDSQPIWSPDGNRIVFSSNRKGVYNLYQKAASGAGSEELILESPYNKVPQDFSPDGRFLLYGSLQAKTGFDLWALPLTGERKAFPVGQGTGFEEHDGQFSPDGKWIAYRSNESGRFEIYVQPFPGPGGKTQISTNGGAQPRWRPDGRELFYIGLDSRLMAAPIRITPNGQAVEPSTPIALFVTRIAGGPLPGPYKHQYAVSHDGQRFLINSLMLDAATSPITLILNWKPPAPSSSR